ncbi:MAG: chemotaxis protein [Rhizobiales bacterium PAR1]|nr:MAG: chemotaxis protein [Rhizobiales bacterium PAR1]
MSHQPDVDNDYKVHLSFMRIDEATGQALREFWPHVLKALPVILEGFYAHLGQVPQLVSLLGAQGARLKGAQQDHWARLFNGRFDADYIAGVRRIGLVHNKIGLEPRWYIGGYAFALSQLTALAIRTYRWRPKRLDAVITALNKAVMLDMDFAISVYQEAMLADRANLEQKETMIGAFERKVTGVLDSVTAASSSLKATAASMAKTAEATSEQASTVAAASEQTTISVTSIATATDQMCSAIGEINRQVDSARTITERAVAEAATTISDVRSLAEMARNIDSVVKIISGIAAQTNLLALNATIEAARAGEAGKGFAVVASEVKALASQTAKATEDIGAQIAAMQGATEASAMRIDEIGTTIETMSQITTSIAVAIEEQEATAKTIAHNIEEAAKGAGDVAQSITGVSGSVANTNAAAADVRSASEQLAAQGDTLNFEITRFLAEIRVA